MRLSDFTALTFDCYGTLIDWEAGIGTALQPLLDHAGVTLPGDAVLQRFAALETEQEAATPGMPYPDILAQVHRRLAAEFGASMPEAAHRAFGASVPDWPAFADSVASLRYLKQHFQLVILSNIDRQSFAASNRRLGVVFDAVFTAEEIGSYKPALTNFDYLLAGMAARGVPADRILHTAQSLFHDHVPAKQRGLASAWIDRRHRQDGWGATMPAPEGRYDFRYPSLDAMAQAHQAGRAA